MGDFSLNNDLNLVATVRLIAKGNDVPLTGDEFRVRLYDRDLFENDFIGESKLGPNGTASINFTYAAFNKGDLELLPDFYFVVFKNGNPVFKSKVMENLDIQTIEQFRSGVGEVIDLGTFLVEVG